MFEPKNICWPSNWCWSCRRSCRSTQIMSNTLPGHWILAWLSIERPSTERAYLTCTPWFLHRRPPILSVDRVTPVVDCPVHQNQKPWHRGGKKWPRARGRGGPPPRLLVRLHVHMHGHAGPQATNVSGIEIAVPGWSWGLTNSEFDVE